MGYLRRSLSQLMFGFNHNSFLKLFSCFLQLLNGITFDYDQILFHVLDHVEILFSKKLASKFPNFS